MSATTIVAENLYEGMFLLDSGKFAADPEGVANQVLGILDKAGATVVAHRPWQDGKLAYEIAGHRKGLHYIVLFRMPGSGVAEITRACKLNELVLRQMVINQAQSVFDAVVAAVSPADESADESAEEPPPAEAPETSAEAPEQGESAETTE